MGPEENQVAPQPQDIPAPAPEEIPAPQNEMPQDDAQIDTGNDIQPDENMMPDNSEEGDDAKKDIQSKTGELSQLLNDYGQPDEELKKYVKGMIDSALDKLDDEPEEDSAEEEDIPDEMPMESVRFTKKQFNRLNEIFAKEHEENLNPKKQKKSSKKNPFNAPKFK